MSEFRVISDEEVSNQISMSTAISIMREAFVQISQRSATVPVRSALSTKDDKGRVLFMPAYVPAYNLLGVKTVSVFPENNKKGLPTIHGKILVFEDQSGIPVALIDAEYLTALRTGAASGLATDLLAHPEAKVLAIFGTGTQSKTQVAAILEVRNIEEVLVFGTSLEKSSQFCAYLKKTHQVKCSVANTGRHLMAADIICTATTATKPLFNLNQIKPGVHINGIGSFKPDMHEIDSAIIKESLLIVDQQESVLLEAGDIIIPIQEGLINENHIYGELGEVIRGSKKGRINQQQITVFKS
ncbi:MAG TPA: hypothetical protein VIS49_07465, partial [Cyclobacteriaceae bacterium]